MASEESFSSAQSEGQVERFVEAATSPPSKNLELQFAAKHAMRSMLMEDANLDGVTDQLQKKKPRWKKWFTLLLLSIVLLIWSHSAWQGWEWRKVNRNSSWDCSVNPDPYFLNLTSGLTPDQHLILLGDIGASTSELSIKPVVDRFPDDPAYYAEYASVYFDQGRLRRLRKSLPDDFDETTSRIAPGNGYFLCMKALEVGLGSVDYVGATARKGGSAPSKRYLIKDQARLDQALHWIHEAAVSPAYSTFSKELSDRRCAILPAGRDLLQVHERNSILSIRWLWPIDTYNLYTLMSAGAENAVSLNHPDDLLSLIHDWESLMRKRSETQSGNLIDLSNANATILTGAHSFQRFALKLSLNQEVERLKRITDWQSSEVLRRKALPADLSGESGSALSKSWQPGTFGALFSWTPPDAALKPGRMADNSLFARCAAFALSLAFLVISGVLALYRFRHVRLIRHLSHSLLRLLSPVDYLWIVMFGFGLPLLWHQLVRLSPWGGLEKSAITVPEGSQGLQIIGLLFTILMSLSLFARWRVKRRTPMLDLGIGRPWFNVACLVITALTMPLLHLWDAHRNWDQKTLLIPLLVPALWWLTTIVHGLFGPADDAPGLALVSRVAGRSCLLGLVAITLTMPIYYVRERHWVALDPVIQNGSTLIPFENEMVPLLSQQNLELLDMLKSD